VVRRVRQVLAFTLALHAVTALLPPEAIPAPRSVPPRSAVPRAEPRRTPQALHFTPGEVVVIADPEALDATTGAPRARDARLMSVLARYGLDRARGAGAARSALGVDAGAGSHARAWVLSSNRPGFDPVAAARELAATGAVRSASPNYRFGLFITQPDDPYYFYQWYVDDGDFADVRLPYAWDTARGDTSVVIAIIDTGVDTTHPDLASRIWRNQGEIPGNGIDDDGNGFVDDVEGWDFGRADNDPKPEYTPESSGIDVGFHGTFCAGIAAASTNNGDGIAGAGWNCRIMPLKVSHPDSGITSEAIAGAFLYAVEERASVISMSFGGPGDPGVPEFFQSLIDLATSSGSVCVAAAGNDGDSVRTYPAACDRVLAVGATDFNNARAEFSNFGSWVDVAAPGSFMFSSICQNYTFTELDQLFYILLFGWDGVNPYMYGDGTSFACPLVAGVCGLVRARFPYLTPPLVMQQIVSTGDPIPYDQPIGPKLNALNAVSFTPTAVAADAPSPAGPRMAAAPNPLSGPGEIRFALPAAGRARVTLYDASGRLVRELADGAFAGGPHAVRWDARDDRGRPVASGIYFARLEVGAKRVDSKVVLIRP
jgi:subtilisin family serine protease